MDVKQMVSVWAFLFLSSCHFDRYYFASPFTSPPPKYCSQNVCFRFAVILDDTNLFLTPLGSLTLVGPERLHLNCNFEDDGIRLKASF